MRRGRPPAATQAPPVAQKPNPSPMRVTNGDPFAALDSKAINKGPADELSSRFPTLDQFSLLHDKGSKFDFDSAPSPPQPAKDLGQRVAEKLADEAFSVPQTSPSKVAETTRPKTVAPVAAKPIPTSSSPATGVSLTKVASAPAKAAEMSRAQAIISNNPELKAISTQSSKYVSTGTMTTTPPPAQPPLNAVPIYRFPPADQHRSSSLPRQPNAAANPTTIRSGLDDGRAATIPRVAPLQSQSLHARHPSSSRPSLEGGRPNVDALEAPGQLKPPIIRPRPASTHLDSNADYLRERDWSAKPAFQAGETSPKLVGKAPSPRIEPEADDTNIDSTVDFLKSMEDSDPKKHHKRASHGKRSSLNALSGTKNILAGKFGDAFKKFENNTPSNPPGPRTPSPLREMDRRDLTPIAGSEATDGRSDDGQVLEETDDMTPEMRREVERRRLSMEEKRVAAAQAEYRQRLAERGGPGSASSTGPTPLPKSIGGVSRAVSIQNRVQSLLSDDQKAGTTVKRMAEGYGKYSDAATAASRVEKQLPEIPRKPIGGLKGKPVPPSASSETVARQGSTASASAPTPAVVGLPSRSATGPGPALAPKPVAPRKPIHLNQQLPTGGRAGSPPKPALPPPGRAATERMVAVDLPGQPVMEMSAQERDDYLSDFAKRFPSLSAIEMVERDLGAEADGRGPK